MGLGAREGPHELRDSHPHMSQPPAYISDCAPRSRARRDQRGRNGGSWTSAPHERNEAPRVVDDCQQLRLLVGALATDSELPTYLGALRRVDSPHSVPGSSLLYLAVAGSLAFQVERASLPVQYFLRVLLGKEGDMGVDLAFQHFGDQVCGALSHIAGQDLRSRRNAQLGVALQNLIEYLESGVPLSVSRSHRVLGPPDYTALRVHEVMHQVPETGKPLVALAVQPRIGIRRGEVGLVRVAFPPSLAPSGRPRLPFFDPGSLGWIPVARLPWPAARQALHAGVRLHLGPITRKMVPRDQPRLTAPPDHVVHEAIQQPALRPDPGARSRQLRVIRNRIMEVQPEAPAHACIRISAHSSRSRRS